MAPKRKKARPSREAATDQPEAAVQKTGNEKRNNQMVQTRLDGPPTAPYPAAARSSWGSWRAKTSPIAQIARESILVAQGATTESSDSARPPNSVSKSVRGSRKSIPLAAEATRVNATSQRSQPGLPELSKVVAADAEDTEKDVVVEEAPLPPGPEKTTGATARSSWLGWWSRPDGYASDGDNRKAKKQRLDADAEEVACSTPLPGTTPTGEESDLDTKVARGSGGIGEAAQGAESTMQPSSKSWFGLWSNVQNQQATSEEHTVTRAAPVVAVTAEPSEAEDVVTQREPLGENKANDKHAKPSAWAFWSSDKAKAPASTPGGTQKQSGELAVADTPSQSSPEPAQFNEQRGERKTGLESSASLLELKPGTTNQTKLHSVRTSAVQSSDQSIALSQAPAPPIAPPPTEDSQPVKQGRPTQIRPNLISPSFRDTFPPESPGPGYIEILTRYLAQTLRFPNPLPTPSPQHVFISSAPRKIRKAVAIGVHGFFPAALLQRVLGQPTGTSIRFANSAAASIKDWCRNHQPDVKDVQIEKVALEGEGYVAERVASLWKLLLNWLSHLQDADFVLVACHSQGVPVAIMLVAKLLRLGCLSPHVRVGVCAMAGINLGPFLEYKSRFFGGTALELFEFSNSESSVSKAYSESLDICLRHGVRITFVGSMDDQLVSLESSLHAPLSHPYVARAVFVDGRLHAPNFLTHLVTFALKLRNQGLSDHGLLRELSGPLAGSLVGGEGHSRIYDDAAVFRLAVEFALESTDVQPLPPAEESVRHRGGTQAGPERKSDGAGATSALSTSIRKMASPSPPSTGIAPTITPYAPAPGSATPNPFHLPWAVRGILEEDVVRRNAELREEVEVLVKEFEEWKPASKVLRDVRWRLEGIRNVRS